MNAICRGEALFSMLIVVTASPDRARPGNEGEEEGDKRPPKFVISD
jgi:hypothetical protein